MNYTNPCVEILLDECRVWGCYIDPPELVFQPYENSLINVPTLRPDWHIIEVRAGFTSAGWPGSSSVLSWLCTTLGPGVLVEGPGNTELLPTDYSWVFYDRGFYSAWPCFTIKFRHEWQKTAFMLQWGHLPITELENIEIALVQ